MKNSVALFPAIALCLLLCTCSKDKNELPPITSRGANTFGCLVNGEPVIFTDVNKMVGGLKGDYDSTGELPIDSADLWITMINEKYSISIYLNNPFVDSLWNLNRNKFTYPQAVNPSDYIMINSLISSNGTIGYFKSKDLNFSQPIFSGTFEFECINPKTCQTLKVTNGRLDVNLNQLQ